MRVGTALMLLTRLANIRKTCAVLGRAGGAVTYAASVKVNQMLDWLEEHVLDKQFDQRLNLVISKFDGYDNDFINNIRSAIVTLSVDYNRELLTR